MLLILSDAINELIDSFTKRYQEGLETKMKRSSYISERVDLSEYHLHKTSLNRGSSYVDSPTWIKNKKVTINPKNTKNNNCFQYAVTAGLNYRNIGHHSEKIYKLEPFINNYNWDNIDFPAGHKDYSAFDKNNSDIAINTLYVPYKTQAIRQVYVSKHNITLNTHANLLMITDGTGNGHYLAVKNISGLLRGITSNHNDDNYCLNCFHSYATEKNLESMNKYVKTMIFVI